MKALKRMLTVLLMIAVVLIAIFLAGRYGWHPGNSPLMPMQRKCI